MKCDLSEPSECSSCSSGNGLCSKPAPGASLRDLVKHYRSGPQPLHRHLASFLLITTFENVIRKAVGVDGKTSSHQWHIRQAVLVKMNKTLQHHCTELRAAKNFDHLLEIIERHAVGGFGRLARYDCALRIGVWLGRMPERVYLHAGTRKGARALRLEATGDSIEISDCPRELRNLRAFEIEDLLCIYKAHFRRIGLK